MRVISKVQVSPLMFDSPIALQAPSGSSILTVEMSCELIVAYFIGEQTIDIVETHHIYLDSDSGHPIPDGFVYVNTLRLGKSVCHVFHKHVQ